MYTSSRLFFIAPDIEGMALWLGRWLVVFWCSCIRDADWPGKMSRWDLVSVVLSICYPLGEILDYLLNLLLLFCFPTVTVCWWGWRRFVRLHLPWQSSLSQMDIKCCRGLSESGGYNSCLIHDEPSKEHLEFIVLTNSAVLRGNSNRKWASSRSHQV